MASRDSQEPNHSGDRGRNDRERDYRRDTRDGPRDGGRDFHRGGRGGIGSRGRGRGGERGGDRRDDHRDRTHHARSRSPARHDTHDRRNSHDRGPSSTTSRRPTDDRRDRDRNNAPPSSRTARPTSTHQQPDLDALRTEMDTDNPDDDEATREEKFMQRVMGFAKFKSTKNTKVPGNDRLYGVRKDKQIQYRQYMNRSGGFNRPLSPSRM